MDKFSGSFKSNVPFSLGYSVAGKELSAADSALANPAGYTPYNHCVKGGKSRRGGRRSRARRSYRRRNLKKCPRGTARKIVGQRRRWSNGVDRIVRHGRLTKKCYRKRYSRK